MALSTAVFVGEAKKWVPELIEKSKKLKVNAGRLYCVLHSNLPHISFSCTFKTRIFQTRLNYGCNYYTPSIYAEGYEIFVFPLVCLSIRMFVRSYFRPVHGITSKFYIKAT